MQQIRHNSIFLKVGSSAPNQDMAYRCFRESKLVDMKKNYPGENEETSELLNDDQIIENVMGNDKEDEVKDNCSWRQSCTN